MSTTLITEPGTRFGRLTVINFTFKDDGDKYCSCECTCGNFVVVREYHLIENITKSCGCLNREKQCRRFYYMNDYLASKHRFFKEEK